MAFGTGPLANVYSDSSKGFSTSGTQTSSGGGLAMPTSSGGGLAMPTTASANPPYVPDPRWGNRMGPAPNLLHHSTPYGQVYGLANLLYGGEMASLRNQQANLLTRFGLTGAQYGNQAAALRNDYNTSMAMLGLGQQGTNIDLASIARQIGYYGNVDAIQQRQFEANMDFNRRLQDLTRQGYQSAVDWAAKQWGFSRRDFENQMALISLARQGIRHQAQMQHGDLTSDATARGAMTASGTRQGFADIERQKELGLSEQDVRGKQAILSHDAEKARILHERKQAHLSYSEKTIGLQREASNMLYDRELGKLSNQEQIARLRDRQQHLHLEAQRYGIQAKDLAFKLQNGLQALGINRAISVGNILEALNSNNYQQAALARQMIEWAIGMVR